MNERAITESTADDEFTPFDEHVSLVAQPVTEIPRTASEDLALQRDLDGYEAFRRKGVAELIASKINIR